MTERSGYLISTGLYMGNRLPSPHELTGGIYLPGDTAPALCHGDSDRCGVCGVELTSEVDGIVWWEEEDDMIQGPEPTEGVTPTGFVVDDDTLYHYACVTTGEDYSLVICDGEPLWVAALERLARVAVFLELDAGKRYDSPLAPLPIPMGSLTLAQLWGEAPMPDAAAPYRAR